MEEMLPYLSKHKNGHFLQVFPVYGMGEELEEIVFWCHTCDLRGENTVSIDTANREVSEVYQELSSIAEWHAEL